MYGAAIGGSFNTSAIDFSVDVAVKNQENNVGVLVGHSASNTGTFNPGGALFPVIGGIGVTDTPSQTLTFSNVGMDAISGSFNLAHDSLVVIVAAASQNDFPSVSSPFTVDQTFTFCCDAVMIAHASMSSGPQAFSISYTFGNGGNADPTERGIGVALYIFSTAPASSAKSSISSDFNGNPIPSGDYVWFNSVVKLKSPAPVTSPLTIHFTHQNITLSLPNGGTITLSVPDSEVIYSPSATSATTVFDTTSNTWITTVPASFSDNVFLAGLAYQVNIPGGLPGGINPVTWSGVFSSSAPFSVAWQWAAAVYTTFSNNYNTLGVKPTHSTTLDAYHNGDQAGTPENFTAFVTGGARGGGGSNCTGSYSSTATATASSP